MKRIFADTFYFLALLNPQDKSHQRAQEFSAHGRQSLVTTAWVMTELADALCSPLNRPIFHQIFEDFSSDDESLVIMPDESLFVRGMELFNSRSDKSWSLTDCISFIVMKDLNLNEALTGDHHFEQAGFRAILK